MRKLIAEPIFIFLSVLASLWVDGYTDEIKEKDELNDSIITLSNEISKNIEYTKEHIYQVKNLKYMTEVIYDNYSKITLNKLKTTHDNNPFFHNIDINGNVSYDKQYDDDGSILWMLRGFLAWEPADIFFKSMLNSGRLLEIENDKLRTEIESIYTKHEERVSGMTNYTRNNSDKIMSWFEDGKNNFDRDILNEELFNNYKDQELKNLLKFRSDNLTGRVDNLENYLQALNNVVLLISSEYKKLD